MPQEIMARFFSPKSVAVIGASPREGSLGQIIISNLLESGFSKENLCAVNPKYDRVADLPCYATVADLPEPPELAVIVSPATTAPKLITELGKCGVMNTIIISAGFSEGNDAKGHALEADVVANAQKHGMRIVGPNCLGILSPVNNFNASFSHLMPGKGNIGVISQSGAMLTSIIDWACGRGIGFSHLVSLGDTADIDFPQMLDFMSSDPMTSAILIYMESISNARRFISAARSASRTKPVVVLKVGRSDDGMRAAASHTGALAGSDDIYEAAFNRSGLLRVNDVRELFYAAASLTATAPFESDRLAIVTNGGGMGVLATDSLIEEGGQLAELSPQTLEKLNEVLPSNWSRANPIDLIGDAGPDRYINSIKILLDDNNIDALLVINCPAAVASSLDIAEAVAELAKTTDKCLLTSWVGNVTAEKCRQVFTEKGTPTYATPEAAVTSFMHMVRYRRNQNILMETPPALATDLRFDSYKAWGIAAKVISEGREWLNELEAKEVLSAYGIPITETYLAKSPEEASALAEKIGFPVVLKLFSPDIVHKSDVRGVALNLNSSEAVRQAASDMNKSAMKLRPDARVLGYTVQKMVKRRNAHELILGSYCDPIFGPILLFGQGGTAVEVINDKAVALPPLNLKLARDMISRTRVSRLLEGYRDRKAVDMDALLLTLMRLSQMVIDLDHLAEIDINPLLVDEEGVIVLDARIKVTLEKQSGADKLAIHPYPDKFVETVRLESGRTFCIRPIRPEDEPALIENFESLTTEEIQFRFFHIVKEMDHLMAARFTQIDYDREMAFVATDPGNDSQWKLYAVVRLIKDHSRRKAEYSLIVNHAVAGQGLGTLLMRRIIAYAKSQKLEEINGEVLAENKVMISICKKLGFSITRKIGDSSIVNVSLELLKN